MCLLFHWNDEVFSLLIGHNPSIAFKGNILQVLLSKTHTPLSFLEKDIIEFIIITNFKASFVTSSVIGQYKLWKSILHTQYEQLHYAMHYPRYSNFLQTVMFIKTCAEPLAISKTQPLCHSMKLVNETVQVPGRPEQSQWDARIRCSEPT